MSLRVEVLLPVCVLSPWVVELYLCRDTLSVANTFITEQRHTNQSRLETFCPILAHALIPNYIFFFLHNVIWTKYLNKGSSLALTASRTIFRTFPLHKRVL